MRKEFSRLLAAFVLLWASVAAHAGGPYSNAFFFGDSLSDTGNIYTLTGGATPASPYFNGRFSDGPVWTEYLAAGIGLPASSAASLQGGTNFAFGGARTAGGSIPSLLAQVGSFTAGLAALDPNALYVVVAGGNDMRDARSAFSTMDAAGAAGRLAAATTATNNIRGAIRQLAAKGARNVLISSLPDLGTTPEAVGLGLVAPSSDASLQFNILTSSIVGWGQSLGLTMSFLDMAGVNTAIRNDALGNGGATYGITNVFTPCGSFQGSIGISCSVSGFSDALHPSGRAHELIGAAALAAVPEPATWLLMAAGARPAASARRRRK
jgi:phospholipase/lecithinase/hemolysin